VRRRPPATSLPPSPARAQEPPTRPPPRLARGTNEQPRHLVGRVQVAGEHRHHGGRAQHHLARRRREPRREPREGAAVAARRRGERLDLKHLVLRRPERDDAPRQPGHRARVAAQRGQAHQMGERAGVAGFVGDDALERPARGARLAPHARPPVEQHLAELEPGLDVVRPLVERGAVQPLGGQRFAARIERPGPEDELLAARQPAAEALRPRPRRVGG
jgi:hypothetical protein